MILYHLRPRRGTPWATRRARLPSRKSYAAASTISFPTEHFSQSRPHDVGQNRLGLAVLAGSWIALYALKPDSWKFVALYLLNGLAQTFLLLNIAHDSNHNAISSVRSVNKVLNYVFDVCGINSYMWRILHHRGHHSCINLHGEDDALTGRRIFRFTPHEPRARLQRFQHIYALFFTRCFLSTMCS
jgi:fatty acid desaturase